MSKKKNNSFAIRIVVPLLIVLAWLGLSGVGGPYFGKIDEVSSNDMATFLPESAESTRVNDELTKFRDSKTLPAIVVFESNNDLTSAETKKIENVVDDLANQKSVAAKISPPIISDDKKAAFIVIPLDSDSEFTEVIPKLQAIVEKSASNLTYKFTGPAIFAQDLNKAFAGIDGVLLLVALSVVFLILLVVYRSPILPIITLLGAIFALSAAILVVWFLAKLDVVTLNGQVQGILFILVIGAATDYALLYISRYREELMNHTDKWTATKVTWKASWEPIVAAGGTVTLGLLCLLVSDLGSNKALGPVGGIGIAFAVLSALTFLPAALLLFGKKAFWPREPKPNLKKHTDYRQTHKTWNRVGQLVGRHPRRLWVGFSALLLIACLFIPQLKADGVSQTDFVLGKSEARDGQALLDKHFPSGSGSPAYVLTPEKDVTGVVNILDAQPGVESVSITTTDADKPAAPIGMAKAELMKTIKESVADDQAKQLDTIRSKIEMQLRGAPETVIDQAYAQATSNVPSVEAIADKAYPFANASTKVVDNNVMLQVTLTDSADSIEARETIKQLRDVAEAQYPSLAFGGVSAVQLDTNTAAEHDLRIIIPLILFVITIILMLLLRAIVAPLVLLLTTVVSFGATLGIAALLFNHVWQFPGADPSVVIYGFVFLVALGIDYNIFLMSRVREETIKSGVRSGTIKALVVTGGVISSAGIVLASTFAALNVIPILFLAQIAFLVAFGVLLDTLIVRSLIVPGITLEVGRTMWWPSKLYNNSKLKK